MPEAERPSSQVGPWPLVIGTSTALVQASSSLAAEDDADTGVAVVAGDPRAEAAAAGDVVVVRTAVACLLVADTVAAVVAVGVPRPSPDSRM